MDTVFELDVLMKICTKCKESKDATKFWKNSKAKDGLQTICIDCRKKWFEENKDRLLEYQKAYHKNNKEKRNKKASEWYQKNKEQAKSRTRKWAAEHTKRVRENYRKRYNEKKEIFLKNSKKYKSMRKSLPGNHTPYQWEMLCLLMKGRCPSCNESVDLFVKDHITPVYNSNSTNRITNIQPLCASCHKKKYRKSTDYRPEFIRLWAENEVVT